eukprot:1157564-Pelagomonas_calceolata.AAC.3
MLKPAWNIGKVPMPACDTSNAIWPALQALLAGAWTGCRKQASGAITSAAQDFTQSGRGCSACMILHYASHRTTLSHLTPDFRIPLAPPVGERTLTGKDARAYITQYLEPRHDFDIIGILSSRAF